MTSATSTPLPTRTLSHLEFSRAIWRAIATPLMLLAAHAVLLSLLLLYWVRTGTWVQHSDQVIARLYDLERLVANMETGMRGYLLTANEAFLDPYKQARTQVDTAFERTRAMVSDDPEQSARLDQVRQLYARWTAIDPHRDPLVQAPLAPSSTAELEQRKQLTDQMRKLLNEMVLVEGQIRIDRFGREQRATVTGIIGGIGVSISLGIALALINRRTVLNLSSAYQTALDEQASSNQQFADLAETIPQLIWITDAQGKHTYFNKPWIDYTGRNSDCLSTNGWQGSLFADDAATTTERWNECFKTGKPFEGQFRLVRGKDRTPRWFLCRALPVLDRNGRLVRWFGTCTDIEDQKQAEHQREQILTSERRARGDLMRAARIKDEFLATLSHELRTPMTAILGWTRLLRDPAIRGKSLDRGIDVIETNAKVQVRLVDDLLDMHRIMSGKLTLNTEVLDFREVVRASIDTITPAARNKKIELVIDIDKSGPLEISGDRGRLQQVVWNLLTNAVKFTPASGKVTVRLERNQDNARLTVADAGVGISVEFLPHVFEQFRQADSSVAREHGGLGLGLAIVQNLVELHGGSVAVFSEGEHRGATFCVELPLASDPRSLRPGGEGEPGDVDRVKLRGKRVLVVDDDAEAGYVMGKVLETPGALVTTLTSGSDALRHLRESTYDLLVSDIGMPGMDGYTLIREWRKLEADRPQRLPAVAVTAFVRTEDRAAAVSAGYDLHVGKPVEPEDLINAALMALQLHPSQSPASGQF
jgi:PAS domain S-box-containing protein